ncbi:MAG: 2-oxoacid:acceptor oxidoreductase family protein, partial [Rhodoplanes sp.]
MTQRNGFAAIRNPPGCFLAPFSGLAATIAARLHIDNDQNSITVFKYLNAYLESRKIRNKADNVRKRTDRLRGRQRALLAACGAGQEENRMAGSDVSIAFVGSGGAGVLTVGGMLLEAACAAGWHGFLTRSVGAQIRGGEAAAMLRLAPHPIDCHSDCFDLLIGIDWQNAQRFEAEIPIGTHSLV